MVNFQTTRRTFIRGAALSAGLGGLSTTVTADSSEAGNRTSLIDGSAEYRVYVADDDSEPDAPNTTAAFGYPAVPVLAGEDPEGGLFDAGTIEKTPNGQTLHHTLQFFQGLLIRKNRGKPYVMSHQGEGRFVSKGQSINFEARTKAELQALFAQAEYPDLTDTEPFATLAGGRWRAVARDVVQFLDNDPATNTIAWSLTRVDFYSLGDGEPSFELSALYVIYPNLDANGQPAPANPLNPTIGPILPPAEAAGADLIEDGRANLGGQ